MSQPYRLLVDLPAVPESPFLGQDCSASCHDLVDVMEELFDIRIEKHRDDCSHERQGDYPETTGEIRRARELNAGE